MNRAPAIHFRTDFVVVQSISHVWLFATPWTVACQVCSNSCPLIRWFYLTISSSAIPSHPSIFPSIRAFSNRLALHISWLFSFSPSSEYSRLVFFWIDWFDLPAVQGALKSLLQHHNLKASIFWCSAFFMVQLSHPYMTTRKTIALTIWTFVGKVLCFLIHCLGLS